MARPVRVEFEGAVYHVTARGNERRSIFRDDEDRHGFLKALAEMSERFGVLVHAYCLMPNHYHLVVETPRANLSQSVGWLQVTYTMRFNARHRRSGHLFQGRFKAQLVDAEGYGRSLVRYVHLNPVRPRNKRAEIPVERREELDGFQWSSHRDYAGLRVAPEWLCLDWLRYWGEGEAARQEYRTFVEEAFSKAVESPWEHLRGGLVLGTELLWKKAQELVGAKQGQDQKRWVQGATTTEVRNRLRQLLRDELNDYVKIWARVRLGGERMTEVAREFGYADGSSVTQIVKRLEARSKTDEQLHLKMNSIKAGIQGSRVDPLIVNGNLTAAQAEDALECLLRDDVAEERKAEFLMALARKGETVEEIAAFAHILRERSVNPQFDREKLGGVLMDVCGTGADGLHTFNVSTTSMFIVAAAGVPIAKHGNRGITSKCGGADVLEALGVWIEMPPAVARRCIEEVGVAFLFAPLYHPAFKKIAPVRRKLAEQNIRTVFNILGPLVNPARVNVQLIGVFDHQLTAPFAEVLQRLGHQRAMVAHGLTSEGGRGMDELSVLSHTHISELLPSGEIKHYTVHASELGLTSGTLEDLLGGDAPTNAATLRRILSGEERGVKTDMVLLNAAAALVTCGKAASFADGLELARQQLESGAAMAVLDRYIAFCQRAQNDLRLGGL